MRWTEDPQGKPIHHFICVDLVHYSVHARFKLVIWNFLNVFLNIFDPWSKTHEYGWQSLYKTLCNVYAYICCMNISGIGLDIP